MSFRTKQMALNFFKMFNVIGLIAVLVLIVLVLNRIDNQSRENNQGLKSLATEVEGDHDLQNSYLKCMFNLFIETEVDEVTTKQTAFCLESVRAGQTKTTTIKPTPANGETTTTTTTTQSQKEGVMPTQPPTPTTQPLTTSAPPDPPQPKDDRSTLGKLPFIGGLFNLIGL